MWFPELKDTHLEDTMQNMRLNDGAIASCAQPIPSGIRLLMERQYYAGSGKTSPCALRQPFDAVR